MSYSDELDHAATVAEESASRAVVEICKKAAVINIYGTGQCELCAAPVEPQWIKDNTEQIIGRWCSIECRDRIDI